MPPSPLLAALDQRRSVPSLQLTEPGPDAETLSRMLAAAVRVPDHGKLAPFRFLKIAGQARSALGEFAAARSLERDPQASEATLEKDRNRFTRAPLVMTVIAKLQPGHRIPEQEQLLTAGCVCFALLQAAQGAGFGAQWLTGWMAYDPAISAHLGLAADERIVGFIHIGTPKLLPPERERPDHTALLDEWQP